MKNLSYQNLELIKEGVFTLKNKFKIMEINKENISIFLSHLLLNKLIKKKSNNFIKNFLSLNK